MLYLKVRLLVNSFRGRIGDVVEVPADLAAAMIAADEAEIVAPVKRGAGRHPDDHSECAGG